MPHRHFIAAVLAAAIAVTGLTAAPARADNDAAKVIAGVAALAVLGAVVADARKSDRPKVIYTAPRSYGHTGHYTRHKHRGHHRVNRFHRQNDGYYHAKRHNRHGGVIPQRARGKRIALPHACIVRNTGGRAVYSARCLERRGFR